MCHLTARSPFLQSIHRATWMPRQPQPASWSIPCPGSYVPPCPWSPLQPWLPHEQGKGGDRCITPKENKEEDGTQKGGNEKSF